MREPLLPVECGACGWKGKRSAGKLVWCPKCGQCAAFQPEAKMDAIKVLYRACDGARIMRSFKTLAGAQKFAQNYVGRFPDMGGGYAVSSDGIGTVRVVAGSHTLADLFPSQTPAEPDPERAWRDEQRQMEAAEREANIAEAKATAELYSVKREPGCTCSDDQLNLVGCDCAAAWDGPW